MAQCESKVAIDNSKTQQVHLFYSVDEKYPNVFINCKLLRTCIIMGQHVDTLEGIQELKYLEELWIVDACLKQENIQPLHRCTKLKRLYLYGNELIEIPNLSQAERLATVWLSDNKIDSLQNINNLISVTEIHLSNNNIENIEVKLKSTLNLTLLSLAGNPISSFKDILKLSALKRLRWLMLDDPLYGNCPVTLMANYRSYVIYSFPELSNLDLITICDSERKIVKDFFDFKCQFYRMALQNTLAIQNSALKSALASNTKEYEMIWSALRHHGPMDNKQANEKNSNLKFWEAEYPRWKERRALCVNQFHNIQKIRKMMLQKELEFLGNIKFEDVHLKQNHFQDNMKTKFNSFICHCLKRRLLEIDILDVWKIHGHYSTTISQAEFQDSWNNIFLLCSVQDLSSQPLEFLEELFFTNKVSSDSGVVKCLSVSNCLVTADPLISDVTLVNRQLLLRSLVLLNSRLVLLCGVKSPDDISNQICTQPHHSPGCCLLTLPQHSSLVPLYLVHFKYVFQDYFKPLKKTQKSRFECSKETSCPALLPASLNSSLTNHTTSLVLTNSNICRLDIPVMENITNVDLSYNQIIDISSILKVFPKLTSLNLAFNKIKTLESLQIVKSLVNLILKWNLLENFQDVVYKLKQLTCLKHLDLSWNPFIDVLPRNHKQVLVGRHLSWLQTYNGHPLTQTYSNALQMPLTLSAESQIPMISAKQSRHSILTLGWKSERSGVESNHMGVLKNQIVSVTLTDIKLSQLRSVFSLAKLKWLNLSHNLITSAAILKNLSALEEVNLSHNVLESFCCPSEKFKSLTRLNLANNYLKTLKNFLPQSFPNLKLLDLSGNLLHSLEGLTGLKLLEELYLSHNFLEDTKTLMNLKPGKCLLILDLSYNRLCQTDNFRQCCVYFLPNLKYLNGSKVHESEVKSSMSLYGGLLDQDYLLKVYSSSSLQSLSHLTLADCSLKTVSLLDAPLPNVSVLTLDHNKLTCLSWVKMFPRLVQLNLSHNHVCSYWEKPPPYSATPPHYPTLHTLLLDHNRIRSLLPLCLESFPNLVTLDLNSNEISMVAGLRGNIRLERLVLDRNRLSYIKPEQVDKLSNLTELYLEHNSLTKLDFILPLSNLQTLFLGFNKLSVKTALTPLGKLSKLEELTVHGNPLFRTTKSYRDSLPELPSLQLLEGHPVNRNNS